MTFIRKIAFLLLMIHEPLMAALPISSPATNGWSFGSVHTNGMHNNNQFFFNINSGAPPDSKYWVTRMGGTDMGLWVINDTLTQSNLAWNVSRVGTVPTFTTVNPQTISNNISVWHSGTNTSYNSLQAARSASASGDAIVVKSGTICVWSNDVSSLLKAGVDLMNDGTILMLDSGNSANSAGFGIVDDRSSGASTNTISGSGTMRLAQVVRNNGSSSSALLGLLVVTNASSQINFRQNELQISNYNFGFSCAAYVKNCRRVDFSVDHVTDMRALTTVPDPDGVGTLTPNCIGVYWNTGPMYIHMNQYYGTAYAVWADKAAGAWTSDLWVEGQSFTTTGSDTLSPIYVSSQDAVESPLWRTWWTVFESAQIGTTGSGACAYFTGTGKHYPRHIGKLGGTGVSSQVNGIQVIGVSGQTIQVWGTVDKISTRASGIILDTSVGGNATLRLTVKEIEDLGGRTDARIAVSGATGTLRLIGGTVLTTNSIPLSLAAASSVFLDNVTLDSSFGVLSPISVSADGLALKNCTLIAPSGVDSITAAAPRNVGVNAVLATTFKNANITFAPNGGFTVDSTVK